MTTLGLIVPVKDDLRSQEREEDWQRRLLGLQKWVAELLIKNQQLRAALWDSPINNQPKEMNK